MGFVQRSELKLLKGKRKILNKSRDLGKEVPKI